VPALPCAGGVSRRIAMTVRRPRYCTSDACIAWHVESHNAPTARYACIQAA
jgi:hypothetical protein